MSAEILFMPAALLCGFGLDLLVGDPERFPHPVRGIGKMITFFERVLRGGSFFPVTKRTVEKMARKNEKLETEPVGSFVKNEPGLGVLLVFLTLLTTFVLTFVVIRLAFFVHPVFAFAVFALLCWFCISARCLDDYAMDVYRCLVRGDRDGRGDLSDNLADARRALAKIVGRDVAKLDEEGVCKGAVESVAENTADGVVAPLFYLALFGPAGGMVYKAANTLDSMVGYKNERYLRFGRAAARLDDFLGYVPSRLAALFMVLAAGPCGQDGRGALRIWRRDGRKHASPNSGQTEAALAGALGVALAGDASYSGKVVKKPAIGDAGRPIRPDDIKTATRLLYCSSLFFLPVAFMISLGASALFIHILGYLS